MRHALLLTAFLVLPSLPALSQLQVAPNGRGIIQMICNIEGAPAQLVAELEFLRNIGGVWSPVPGPPRFWTENLGGYKIYYGGYVRSQSAAYSFTGEDAFADFVDLKTNARFRVQFAWTPQGQLVLTVNPFADAVQYLCAFPH